MDTASVGKDFTINFRNIGSIRFTHNSHAFADSIAGKVLGEASANTSVVTVCTSYLAPDCANAALVLEVGRR